MPATDTERTFMEYKPYREVHGGLLYIATRILPDIATAVSLLGKFQSDPGQKHWRCVQRMVRYLIRSIDHGLFLPGVDTVAERPTLSAYSDADWARDMSKRRSRSGFIVLVNYTSFV